MSGGHPEVAGLSDSAWAVLKRRYLRRDAAGNPTETPAEMFRRVARAVAAPDASYGAQAPEVAATEERFYRRMTSFEFLPNSPALMNAGRPRGQLAACFVVPVGDSMPEIFDAVKWAAEIQQTGGGTGFAFSRLRPSGDRVASTGGVASGPLAFMDVFNAATDAVKQGGTRRGANMGVLRVDHPDILEFVAAKLDPRRLTNFNVSVALTDAFMDAVARGGEYELVNPRTGQPVRRLDARRVFRAISTGAWKSGEPGVLFIDRMNAEHPIPDAGDIEATNPCVTGDTRVLVEGRGWLPIRELCGHAPSVATWRDGSVEFRRASRVVATGVKPVLRLTTLEGLELRLTAEHLVATERGDVPAAELERGDRVRLMIGAGPRARVSRDGADARLGEVIAQRTLEACRLEGVGATPDVVWRGSVDLVSGYLRGLFAEATLEQTGERAVLRLCGREVSLLREAQLLLLRLGVVSALREASAAADLSSLTIAPGCLKPFAAGVGLTDDARRRALVAAIERGGAAAETRAFATVSDVVDDGEDEVFDLSEPDTSHFFANGLLVHNCAEQPLLAFESCVLGSVNLGKFVDRPSGRDGGKARVAWQRLGEAVRDGVHFLDNVIDANHYPLPQIEAVTRAHRKIGLGVMGFADLLVELGVPYDSPQALEVAQEVAAFVERESLAASAELAAVRGPFARFATSRWAHGGRPPLRNATTTTVAPTGTISILAGCSSGIEPIFALSLVRRVLEGARLVEVHPIFQAMAEERGVWSDELMANLAERGRARGLDGVPRDLAQLFPTAHDVTPEQHVRMQAAFQRHSHSAVSKTVNLPESATVEDVEQVYRLAYELGCKGVTVYRDGSRDAQVLSFGERGRDPDVPAGALCPECGDRPLGDGACSVCPSCGWARCAVP